MELIQSNTARMAMYGITIGVPQLVLTLLANIKTATKSEYSHKFCSAMHAIRKKYTYNHVHDAASLQTILMELAGANGVRVLKDAPAPSAGMACSVADLVSFLHSIMDGGDTNSEYTKLHMAPPLPVNCQRMSANHTNETATRTSDPSHMANKRRKRRRTTLMHPQRTPAFTARNFNAGSPIALTRTNACGTKNTRDTISNPSVTGSRWLSSHATSLRCNWMGTRTKRIRRADDGARGQRMLRGRMIQMDGSKLNGRTVIRTK